MRNKYKIKTIIHNIKKAVLETFKIQIKIDSGKRNKKKHFAGTIL